MAGRGWLALCPGGWAGSGVRRRGRKWESGRPWKWSCRSRCQTALQGCRPAGVRASWGGSLDTPGFPVLSAGGCGRGPPVMASGHKSTNYREGGEVIALLFPEELNSSVSSTALGPRLRHLELQLCEPSSDRGAHGRPTA